MGFRIDVRVDAQRHARLAARRAGHAVEALKLAFGLDIEAENADLERAAHLGRGFADTGKDDLAGVAAGGEHALEFPAGHDVKAGAGTGEQAEDGQIGIGLHPLCHVQAGIAGLSFFRVPLQASQVRLPRARPVAVPHTSASQSGAFEARFGRTSSDGMRRMLSPDRTAPQPLSPVGRLAHCLLSR